MPPRGPRKDDKNDQSFARIQQIWQALSFEDWLALVSEHKPETQPTRLKNQIQMKCYFHPGDDKPSFYVTPSKGIVKCFGGSCQRVFTNPVKFVSTLLGCNYGEALLFLRKRFGLRGILPEPLIKHYQEFSQHQENLQTLCKSMKNFLIKAIKEPDADENIYARDMVNYYLNTRKWSPELATCDVIGILPPELYLAQEYGADSPMFKWAQQYLKKVYESANWLGSMVFFNYCDPITICRIKIRRPSADKSIIWIDDPFESATGNFRGVYGLNVHSDLLGDDRMPGGAKSVHVVEGEGDALSILNRQILEGRTEFLVASLGGKGAQLMSAHGGGALNLFNSLGIDTINIMQDCDSGGDGFITTLLDQASNKQASFRILRWPTFAGLSEGETIKDPDQWINKYGYDSFCRYVTNPKNYAQPYQWVFDAAADQLEKTDPEDIRNKYRIAVSWGKHLQNPAECKAYCSLVSKSFNLDDVVMYRDIQSHDETEMGFIQRIMDALTERFHFIGVEGVEGHKSRVELWDKETRSTVRILLNDGRSAETALATYYGTLTEFIRERVGDASFLSETGDVADIPIVKLTDIYRNYVTFALLRLSKGLPNIQSAPRKAQGFHYVGTNDADGTLCYLVNGRDVYKMTWPDGQYTVAKLDAPKDKGTIFTVDDKQWLTTVHSAQDLLDGASYGCEEIYDTIYKVISTAWLFKHHDIDAHVVTSYMMCVVAMSLFPRQTAVMFNAEAQSGKSKLASGVFGSDFPSIRLVASSVTMNDYSAASVQQRMNNCSQLLILEEFEDKGGNEKRSVQTRNVQELTRDMVSEHGVDVTRGSATGAVRSYHLRFPMLVTAIHPFRDQASRSRYVTIEMIKQENRADPQNVVLQILGPLGVSELRHKLAVALYPHAPKLREMYFEVAGEYGSGAKLPSTIPARFREGLYPILAMQKFCGKDYNKFMMDLCASRKDQLAGLAASSENEQVFEAVLSSPITIQMGSERVSGKTTIRAMLSNAEPVNLLEINKTKCGVYIDTDTNWLIVNWVEALQGVLSSSRFGRETSSTYLKDIASRSPFHVPVERVKEAKIIERLRAYTGPGMQLAHCTVFDIRHLIEEARRSVSGAEKVAGSPAPDKAQATESKAAAGGDIKPFSDTVVGDDDDDFKV